jgi:hypothetical protein
MNYTDVDFTTIKFKKPVKYANGHYIALNEGLIIETPKLKICYSCNRISQPGTNRKNGQYNYSVSIPEDLEFATFIEKFEEVCIAHLKLIKNVIMQLSTSQQQQPQQINFTFNSALIASDDADPAFKFKLRVITDKDGSIMTLMTLNTGAKADITHLKLDNNTVQYIECSGISITNDGQVYPIWIAHQIVIIPFSKIYKKKMLIDILREKDPDDYPIINEPIIQKKNVIVQSVNPVVSNVPINKLALDPNMLQNMKSKLKSNIAPLQFQA